MAFDKYVKVPGSEREPMRGGTKAGSLDPNEVMQVTLVLRPRASVRSTEPLDNLVARGERISREEYQARYGADPADVQHTGGVRRRSRIGACASEPGGQDRRR